MIKIEFFLKAGSIFGGPSVLVLDAFPAHKKPEVKSAFKRWSNTTFCIIPGGLTSVIQPLDVYINRSFKSNIRKEWRLWLTEGIYFKKFPAWSNG